MGRPVRALIDVGALRHNLTRVRHYAPQARVMAIIKADGYGHGLARVARALVGADAFGLASVEEARNLRAAGVTQPLCLLEGFFDPAEIPLLSAHQVATVVHHEAQVQALERCRVVAPIDVWLKIDTGMHRLGFAPQRAAEVLARLQGLPAVGWVRLLSHLANADDPRDACTQTQIECFRALCPAAQLERSLANSAGIVAWPETHFDWVRPGIMLYGVSPLTGSTAHDLDLHPAMTLESEVIAVHRCRKGDAIGYGGTWVCPEDMPVGVVACGYGDGYPRHAPSGTAVLVNGRRVALIGRVSMDMLCVDLRTQPDAAPGMPVVLWGHGLPIEEVAESAGTIAYQLLCSVAMRVPRVEVDAGQTQASADPDAACAGVAHAG